jgi:hypothetical protein
MSRPPDQRFDVSDLQAEMRRVLPTRRPGSGQTYRDIRAQNQARYEASLRMRQRPTRVS